ncbi:MAG: hypothetical protein WCT03_17500 [Candidatus Obscuribacterales bacterium]|jgi:hypothetical protein
MKIKIWNAFASNNSGSYTIVGNFSTSQLARDVATELTKLVEAHHKWIEACEGTSPLSEFAKTNGLSSYTETKYHDDWPESFSTAPEVLAIDQQVFIHHPYVITLPALFGQYFYSRGGRVEIELNHSHNPLVASFSIYVHHEKKKTVDSTSTFASILRELIAPDGPLSTGLANELAPAWKIENSGFEKLTFGACFEDLVKSFAAIEKIIANYDVRSTVQLFEAPSEKADPLLHLRQSGNTVNNSDTKTKNSETLLDTIGSFFESIIKPRKM